MNPNQSPSEPPSTAPDPSAASPYPNNAPAEAPPSVPPEQAAPPQHAGMPQPVAYDQQGRPLYAQPPNQPQLVYMTRPIEPADQPVPEDVQQKHEASRRQFPQLNLSEGEYVISAIKRHPIGLFRIWGVAFGLVAALLGLFGVFLYGQDSSNPLAVLNDPGSPAGLIAVCLLLLALLIVGGAFVAAYVYNNNSFYLTNESVIQEIQQSLFARHEQTVSLSNIEDASYRQDGILPSLLDYGLIRLSTEGDETTYRFNYVTHPKKNIAVLNNAVEAFKLGRRVEND